jgi:hypothetical protein
LVFVTKYRRDALSEPALRDLSRIFAKVCKDFEADLIECNGEDDHVHLLIVYPVKVALSKLVNSLKRRFVASAARVETGSPGPLPGRRSLVAVLFRRIVRRRATLDHCRIRQIPKRSGLRPLSLTSLP